MLTEQDLRILTGQEPDTLAKWWCQLNRWQWPPELPDEESVDEYYTHMLKAGGGGVVNTRRSELMKWIEGAVHPRALSREWNREMPDDHFEDFWRGNHEGDAEALERYRIRLHEEAVHKVRMRSLSKA